MLYRTLLRLIEHGQAEGMEEKIDLFYAMNKLMETEYQELIAILHREKQ